MRPRGLILAEVALAAALAGCGEPGPVEVSARPPEPVARVDHIYPQLWPAAINLDDVPGPDGLRINVLLFLRDRPLPVTVAGTIEFLLFDGRLSRGDVEANKPRKVWTFEQAELPAHLRRMQAGWGYAFDLAWGKDAPTSDAITLAVRYLAPTGPPLYSRPISIRMKQK